MVDPLSITTGLVGLFGSLVKLNEVRGDVFEAKSEIASLFREVDLLMNVLTHLQSLKQIPERLSQELVTALQDCTRTAEKADIFLLRSSLNPFPGIYWAYTGKKEVLQFCRALGAQKDTIGLILNLSSLHASSQIHNKSNEILAEIKDLRLVLPEKESAFRRLQHYAESVNEQSSTTYVDEEFQKLPTDAEWEELLSPIQAHGELPSDWQFALHKSTGEDFEDDLTSNARYRLHRTLSGLDSGVSSVAFSSDGRQLLSGSWDGSLRLWDVEMECTLQSIQGHSDDAGSVVFVGDDTVLASASSDSTIKFWDAHSGSLLQRLDDHDDRIAGLAYAKYTGELASGSGDGTIRIWDIETGSAVRTLHCDRGGIWSIAISEDGRQLISGSGGGTVSIWDIRVKSSARILEGHQDGVRSLAISRDNIASGSWDRTVMIWDIRTGKTRQILQTQDDHITSVVYLGQKWLASGSGDESTFKLWDTETGRLAQELHMNSGSISSLAFSDSNGGQLASGSGGRTIGLWSEVSGGDFIS